MRTFPVARSASKVRSTRTVARSAREWNSYKRTANPPTTTSFSRYGRKAESTWTRNASGELNCMRGLRGGTHQGLQHAFMDKVRLFATPIRKMVEIEVDL